MMPSNQEKSSSFLEFLYNKIPSLSDSESKNKELGQSLKNKKWPTQRSENYLQLPIEDFYKQWRLYPPAILLPFEEIERFLPFKKNSFYLLLEINGQLIASQSILPDSSFFELSVFEDKFSSFNDNVFESLNFLVNGPWGHQGTFKKSLERPFIHLKLFTPDMAHHCVFPRYRFLVSEKVDLSFGEICFVVGKEVDSFASWQSSDWILHQASSLELYEHLESLNSPESMIGNSRHFHLKNKAKVQYSSYKKHSLHWNRQEVYSSLEEESADFNFSSFAHLYGNGKQDIKTFLSHEAEKTFSTQNLYTLLEDSSLGIFSGNVSVASQAQEILATQLNKNVLLNSKARTFNRPQLTVRADNVKCTHGSATGPLQKEELFYLQSRGLSEEKSKEFLLKAIYHQAVNNLSAFWKPLQTI